MNKKILDEKIIAILNQQKKPEDEFIYKVVFGKQAFADLKQMSEQQSKYSPSFPVVEGVIISVSDKIQAREIEYQNKDGKVLKRVMFDGKQFYDLKI